MLDLFFEEFVYEFVFISCQLMVSLFKVFFHLFFPFRFRQFCVEYVLYPLDNGVFYKVVIWVVSEDAYNLCNAPKLG